jgi:hypothetical protein
MKKYSEETINMRSNAARTTPLRVIRPGPLPSAIAIPPPDRKPADAKQLRNLAKAVR